MAQKIDKTTAFFKSFADADENLSVQVASERVGLKVPSISTGSLILDDILGNCCGYPLGRIIQLYGAAGSGKSLMAMLAIKQAQNLPIIYAPPGANEEERLQVEAKNKANKEAMQVYIDAEQTFNVDWAEKLGLDPTRIYVIDEDLASNGRRCFEMILGCPKEDAKHILVGKSKEGLLDKIKNKEMNINLIVLDSLGAIIPPIEDVAAVGKNNMTPMARFLTTTFKKLSPEVSKANIPFIIINHKRDSLELYGADHTFSGGNTYAHFLSANIYFEAVMRKDALILDEKENKIGHLMRATIEKSKFGPWPRKCEFKVNFGIGIIDTYLEIAQLALDYNIVLKTSPMTHEYGDQKWTGYSKYCEALNENPDLAAEILAKVSAVRDSKIKLQPFKEEPEVDFQELITEKVAKKAKK